jgi:hypothetical protein
MIISDLNHLEVVANASEIQGSTGSYGGYTYVEKDFVSVTFETKNTFNTNISVDLDIQGYSASFGAKAQVSGFSAPYYVFSTKADGLGVVTSSGSFSAATGSAAAVKVGY